MCLTARTRRGEPANLGGSGPAAFKSLLLDNPRLRVLTLTNGGRIGYVDRLVMQRTVLKDVSPEELIDAVLGEGRFGENEVLTDEPLP